MKDPHLPIRSFRPPLQAQMLRPKSYAELLEATLTQSLQWVAFEPTSEALWAKARSTLSDHLINEWQRGALLGAKPEQAFFVKCDRTTMTEADIDRGRLICLVGVAPVKPAEFVVFRIDQGTAGSKA
jgi:uncharacterized protein